MRLVKLVVFVITGFIAVLFVGSWYVANKLAAPALAEIGDSPGWLNAETVEIRSGSGSVIRGWLAGSDKPSASVLLLHSVRGNRRSMLGRARFLAASNYQVLLIDLQAHGASGGDYITFGHLESRDAIAAVHYLKQSSPEVPLFVLGSSLGGAAALLAEPPLSIDGLIIEAVYPTIESAVNNRLRMRFGSIGELFTPLFIMQLEPRLGISASDLRPMDFGKKLNIPVFVIAGQNDAHTTVADTRALFDALAGPKQLWLVPNAVHQDLHLIAGTEYERKVLQFLSGAVEAQPNNTP